MKLFNYNFIVINIYYELTFSENGIRYRWIHQGQEPEGLFADLQ
jgi:hypothetical protein